MSNFARYALEGEQAVAAIHSEFDHRNAVQS
jgi:hypothetical protein